MLDASNADGRGHASAEDTPESFTNDNDYNTKYVADARGRISGAGNQSGFGVFKVRRAYACALNLHHPWG